MAEPTTLLELWEQRKAEPGFTPPPPRRSPRLPTPDSDSELVSLLTRIADAVEKLSRLPAPAPQRTDEPAPPRTPAPPRQRYTDIP